MLFRYHSFISILSVIPKTQTSKYIYRFKAKCILKNRVKSIQYHYSDVIMNSMASQITCVSIVCSTVCSGADQRKRQSSASLTFVTGIHRKMFPFDVVIMSCIFNGYASSTSSAKEGLTDHTTLFSICRVICIVSTHGDGMNVLVYGCYPCMVLCLYHAKKSAMLVI